MRKVFLLALIALEACILQAAPPPPADGLGRNGIMVFKGLEFYPQHFNKEWNGSSPKNRPFEIVSFQGAAPDLQLQGKLKLSPDLVMPLTITTKAQPDGAIDYQAQLESDSPIPTRALCLNLLLPTDKFAGQKLTIDGKDSVTVTAEFDAKKDFLLYKGNARELQITTQDGIVTLSGKLFILIQDDRKWNLPNYAVRISFTPDNGDLTRSNVALQFKFRPYQSKPIDLTSAMNMGLRDDAANDRKGGWTDQGPSNDLRMLKPGLQRLGGIDFTIVDPASNQGKACLMLAGNERPFFPMTAEVPVTGIKARWLYLLHALAWPSEKGRPVGQLTVTYQNGETSVIPVNANKDVNDWWAPVAAPNGALVWTGENQSSYVGLFRSAFAVKPEPIKSIRFESTRTAVWGVVALSASDDQVPSPASAPIYIVPNREWQPIAYYKDIVKGSVMDFSTRLDAPAGKYGKIIVRNGKLVFADRPDVPVRFYGQNLCGSAQYLDKAWAERLAERLAASGYNAVRIHHHDDALVLKKNGTSTELNPVKVDQLDYFIACCKKRGLYITTDLYVSRSLVKGEIPEFPDQTVSRTSFKGLAFVCPSVMTNWEKFSRNWLTHVNPYTGMALKDDPVLISLSLINEDTIEHEAYLEPWVTEYYMKKFSAWLAANGKSGSADKLNPAWPLFLFETYNTGFAHMKQFVRDLGCAAIISDQNMQDMPILTLMRNNYDYVDNHFYWDHPRFPITPWKLPASFSNVSALSRYAEVPACYAPTRIYGKPMMITEFDFATPNHFRAEGGVLTGAYAGVQGWDALFHFAYAHGDNNVINPNAVAGFFDTSADPTKALSERIGIIEFLWDQVTPAPLAFAVPVSTLAGKDFTSRYPSELNRLALVAQVGSVVPVNGQYATGSLPENLRGIINIEPVAAPAVNGVPQFQAVKHETDLIPEMTQRGILKSDLVDLKRGIYRSAHGQLELNHQDKTFKAVTPGCEAMILPEKLSAAGQFMQVVNQKNRAVFCIAAVDRRPLVSSRRMLILHITNTLPTKMKFGNAKMTLLESNGQAPFLVQDGKAQVTLTGAKSGVRYQLYAVTTGGERLYQVPVTLDADGHPQFALNIISGKEPAMAYELIQE